MKVHDYVDFQDDSVLFIQSNRIVALQDIQRLELAIRPVKKTAGATILNASSNFLTSSVANGNELVLIQINVETRDGIEEIILHETPFVRGTDDYRAFVERARKLKDVMHASFKKHGALKKEEA